MAYDDIYRGFDSTLNAVFQPLSAPWNYEVWVGAVRGIVDLQCRCYVQTMPGPKLAPHDIDLAFYFEPRHLDGGDGSKLLLVRLRCVNCLHGSRILQQPHKVIGVRLPLSLVESIYLTAGKVDLAAFESKPLPQFKSLVAEPDGD